MEEVTRRCAKVETPRVCSQAPTRDYVFEERHQVNSSEVILSRLL